MKKNIQKIGIVMNLVLIAAVLVFLVGPPAQIAHAAALTNMKDTLSTLKINTVANQTVMFRMSSGGGEWRQVKQLP